MTELTLARPPAHTQRLAYLGTPEVAVEPLRALVAAGFDVAIVISGADKRRGRGSESSPSPVKAAAIEMGLPVSDQLDDVLSATVDLAVVVAYGRIIPVTILEHVPMINIHFSLLPRWRGAAPVERALLAGDTETGVSLMDIGVELDTGDVYAESRTHIADNDTLASLRERLVRMGATLLVDSLKQGLPAPRPQTGDVTYAKKISSEDLHVDWTRASSDVDRLVRLGGAWTTFRGTRLKIHEVSVASGQGAPGSVDGLVVACGEGAVELLVVQPEGKAKQDASSWKNGARVTSTDRLGQ
ncbi:MAG: methionyl-tRNA formyltransferase [Actinobacteria bacterium]|uniref:methionyl-tRNA formyltransferase n=2 Tax=freshwater metagenome TaxID=449393 RepID=A0A6J5ZYS5_9ZZZZ|nr:methionyl-tRNA formyltransferase [Actinomycetota bacterium]MTA42960.1 methionyl-tRNA formyltransferase [Actinomycetota bacterium]MTA45006.1 methionyl-tRNA formyltransferase [Actinomycetota bacterium]